MHRRKLFDLLEKYKPNDADEIYNKQQAMSFLTKYQDCFRRELEIGHFTGSCWLLNCNRTKFLLTKHKKLGLWLQLGGHADGDSDILNVALKEAREESGLGNIEAVSLEIFDIGYHFIPKYNETPSHYHYDIRFLAQAKNSDDEIRISNESDDLRWFEIPPTSNVGVNRMFKKWKALSN
ncbi:MAG: NUDIX hydrolase [Holosporales bacterium]|jgi:8-oxo-dGTP pyrophosphatase MutT (NUDIX family)|nr:NUDIX hydrolase [Holosporales bacterium]